MWHSRTRHSQVLEFVQREVGSEHVQQADHLQRETEQVEIIFCPSFLIIKKKMKIQSWGSETWLTFSCFMCLSSLSSRYARLANSSDWNGLYSFLMATLVLVLESTAELRVRTYQRV